MVKDSNIQAFFALVRAGLWEKEVRLLPFGKIDFNVIFRIAKEQSVLGLVAAGMEYVEDVKTPHASSITFAGMVLQLVRRNLAMNAFIEGLIQKLQKHDAYALLVKGQGVAQCYEKPLWRACGDVDLYLSKDNYEKAKALLLPIAQNVEKDWG